MIFLDKNASFAEVESYVKNQLINQVYLDVDFYLAMGNLYTLNIRIGEVNMFDSEAVRIAEKLTYSKHSAMGEWIANIIIAKGYNISRDLIDTLSIYFHNFSDYLVTRDHAKDTSEWEKYEKKGLR